MMVPTTNVLPWVLWLLSSFFLLGSLIAYVMWRSWQSAHHTNQVLGRRPLPPVTDVTKTREAVDGEKIHP